ncbi:MAG: acyloxyacyl hydrolase [Acidobacteriota bacterium]
MRTVGWFVVVALAVVCAAPLARAQTARPASAVSDGAAIWTVAGNSGWGVEVFHSDPGHDYLMPSVSWGRVLTGPRGPGALRGHFEWAVEGVPLFAQRRPQRLVGVGFSPLVWRWNFVPRGRVAPYAELAGGLLWTNKPIPAETTTVNWTAFAGAGLRIMATASQGLVLGYRFHHISNGNRLEKNPGVNANMAHIGWTLIRR